LKDGPNISPLADRGNTT